MVQNLPVPFDRRVWLEATTLVGAGWDVSVISPKAKGFVRSFEHLEGVDIYRYRLPNFGTGAVSYILEFLWCFLQTGRLLARVSIAGGGYHVLHACNPPETFWPYGVLGKLFGKKFLFDHHDLSPEMFAAKYRKSGGLAIAGLRLLERATFATADLVITTNESHKQVAVERGGKDPDDVIVVRSGPDLDRFSVFPPDPQYRKGKRFLITYLGEICEQDGVDHLVRALRVMRDDLDFTDFHCVLVGGGPHQPAIKAYAADLGVDDLCTFTGRVSDEKLCRVLSSADLGVDPDPWSEWSDKSTMNKIMEYMFFGLPIVSFDLTEARVSAQSAAKYVEGTDEALAKGIVALLVDPQERESMAAFGRHRLRSALSWEHSAPRLLDAYRRLMPTASNSGPAKERRDRAGHNFEVGAK